MKTLITALIVALPILASAQDNTNHIFIKRVTDKISYVNQFKCKYIGWTAQTHRQYIRFDSLQTYCTDAELLTLVEHKSPVVRSYAFLALSERKHVELYPILHKHRRDRATFQQKCACMVSTNNVTSSMMNIYKKSNQYIQDTLDIKKKLFLNRLERKESFRFDIELLLDDIKNWFSLDYRDTKKARKLAQKDDY